jgi:hypothetical protein
MADPGTPMVDSTGLARLDRFPAYLVATVDSDGERPVVGRWPAAVPAEMPLEVTLDLTVPAGDDREVSVILALAGDDGAVTTYAAPGPGEPPLLVDVPAGAVAEVDAALAALGFATVRATWDREADVAGVAWVDEVLGVAYPAQAPDGDAVETALAVGRLYWPRVELESGDVLDLRTQSVALARAGEVVQARLDIVP